LDMEKVGVLGWSFGGATAGQIMVTDDRFKAGLNMDGSMVGDVLDSALTRPFFFMERGNKAGLDRLFFKRATGPAYYATIAGTRHVNFGDISIHGDFWRLIGLLGEIDGQRGLEIINRYTLAFFDRHLKQREAPLLDGQALEYPEVQLQRRNVGGVTNALPQTKPNFF
ncbi:MAG: prolyl oligopeptidase family serine peptidase, partial [bacterium]